MTLTLKIETTEENTLGFVSGYQYSDCITFISIYKIYILTVAVCINSDLDYIYDLHEYARR